MADVLERNDKKEWDELSPVQLGLARQAAEELVQRVEEKDASKGFKPKDQRIVIWDQTRADAVRDAPRPRLRPQVFRIWAPGYSRNREVAIIRLSFPWSIHSGEGTYVLAKQNGEWVVLIRDFVYYV